MPAVLKIGSSFSIVILTSNEDLVGVIGRSGEHGTQLWSKGFKMFGGCVWDALDLSNRF